MAFGSKKITEEMPRNLFGPNGIMTGIKEVEEIQYGKPVVKTKLDQIADLIRQLTYDEMLEYGTDLTTNATDQPAFSSTTAEHFASLLNKWSKDRQTKQLSVRLDD